jgi:hypothetical protein
MEEKKLYKKLSKKELFKIMDKLKVYELADEQKLMGEITKRQKDIFSAFKISKNIEPSNNLAGF